MVGSCESTYSIKTNPDRLIASFQYHKGYSLSPRMGLLRNPEDDTACDNGLYICRQALTIVLSADFAISQACSNRAVGASFNRKRTPSLLSTRRISFNTPSRFSA